VQVTRDGGATWTNVTANVPGIPPLGSVRHVEPSKYDVASAYIIVDAHQENNRDPWIYRTKDFGKTWTLIVNGIPKSPLSYAHIIREDPVRRGLLYAGTENTLYVSFDDGDHWQPLKTGLPSAPVYGMVIQPHFDDLVIGTYGRGFFILDDLHDEIIRQAIMARVVRKLSILQAAETTSGRKPHPAVTILVDSAHEIVG